MIKTSMVTKTKVYCMDIQLKYSKSIQCERLLDTVKDQ